MRTWLVQLATYYDFNIAQVSYDGYQSRESLQALRRAGIRSCEISVDRTLEPYLYLRSTLYHDRLIMVESEILRVELVQLELNAETNKVDHPPRGSKDLADAVCGAVYGASQSRLVRSAIGYRDPDGAPAHRPGRGERPKRGPRRSFGTRTKRITAASIKQDRYDFYRALAAQEDEDFRNRYDGGNK